jgi:transcription antitermination factor NusG
MQPLLTQQMIVVDQDTAQETCNQFPWYALRTKSNQEKTAATILEHQGYELYFPVYRTRRRWSDRVVEAHVPLFPGYIFCRFDAKKRLPIISTPGIVSVVGFGNEPVAISDSEIDAVRTILHSGLSAGPCRFLREGQSIFIKRGPLAGLEGILLRKKSEWTMVVSITMLQRSVSVDIDREWITAI